MELIKYNKKQHESLLLKYYSKKDLDRYTNKGIYRVLSLLGIYHSEYYVLSDNQVILGCVLIRTKISRTGMRASWIYDVFVLPEYRGKGYGQELMKLAIESCTMPKIYLYVRKDNKVALNLYDKMGFVEAGAKDNEILLKYDKV